MAKRSQAKQIMLRQKQFIHQWNIGQQKKIYDALEDKHASYYFGNPGVKKHLKKLKKCLNKEPGGANHEKIASLLDQIIKKKDKYHNKSDYKIEVYSRQVQLTSLEKISNKAYQKTRRSYIQQYPEQSLKLPPVNDNPKTSKTVNRTLNLKLNPVSKSKHNQKNNLQHAQFLDFLQKKKQQVQKNTQQN